MRLRDGFHRVQQQAESTTHRGAELTKSAVHKIESTLRRTLKSHGEVPPISAHPDPMQEPGNVPPAKARTGIVSVNGRDVEKMCCTGGKRTA